MELDRAGPARSKENIVRNLNNNARINNMVKTNMLPKNLRTIIPAKMTTIFCAKERLSYLSKICADVPHNVASTFCPLWEKNRAKKKT